MSAIVAEARRWIGTPFKHQGRDSFGIDCIGLCVMSLRASGMVVDDITDYPRDPYDGKMERVLRDYLGPPVEELQVGDIVVIAFPVVARHLAIVGDYIHGGLSLIQSWNGGAGRVVEIGMDDKWRRRIVAVHRWESV